MLRAAFSDIPTLTHWLVSRQFAYLDPSSDATSEDSASEPPSLARLSLDENLRHVGFNGRCNKVADTCYTWWVGATLATLGKGDLVARVPARRFLLEKTQHLIGGLAKHPGGPPDMYHAYFGLAALAAMGEPGLKEIDTTLAVSVKTAWKIEAARDGLLRREVGAREKDNLGARVLDMGVTVCGGRPEWFSAVVEG